ncbi:hypothetical protein TYRP_019385 [Tyrophagus putrescentiae]|nr:hypothetical protein TYRP_019385 [Tyrophagus putrescentiae]
MSLLTKVLKNLIDLQGFKFVINSNALFQSAFLSSLISERFSSLGDFEDCMSVSGVESVRHTDNNNNNTSPRKIVSAQYCLVRVQSPSLPPYPSEKETFQIKSSPNHMVKLANNWLARRNQINFLSGICVPSVCNTGQLTDLIDEYFAEFLNGMEVAVGYCQQGKINSEYSVAFQVARFILGSVLLIVFTGTILHCALSYLRLSNVKLVTESPVLQTTLNTARCFNVQYNLKRLFSGKSLQHRRQELDTSFINGLRALLILGTLYVHSHTFLSVYLFSTVSVFEKNFSFYVKYKKEHPLRYNLVYRSFLLVDLFFVLSGFLATFKVLSKSDKKVPNFLSYVFHHYIRLAPSMAAILILTILAQHLGSGPLFHPEITDPYVKPCYDYWMPLQAIRLYYTSPQSHIVAYFSGALIAMRLLAKKQDHFSKYATPLVVLSSAVFILGTVLPIDVQLSEQQRQSALFMAAFLLFFTVIVLSESLFFYFLLAVRSSAFKQLLSSRFLAPLGRLSFSIYLLNPLVNWMTLHQIRQTVPLTFEHLRNIFFVDFFRTFIWAILLYLFVEAPITNVRNLVMGQSHGKRRLITTTSSDKQSPVNAEEETCL